MLNSHKQCRWPFSRFFNRLIPPEERGDLFSLYSASHCSGASAQIRQTSCFHAVFCHRLLFPFSADTHAGELKDSLADEVEGARKDVGAVAQQRDQAAKKLSSLEKELERLTALKTQMQVEGTDIVLLSKLQEY